MTDELSRDLKDSAPADLEFATIELANFIWASDATSPFSKPQFDVPEINADVKKYFKTSVRNLKNKSDDASTLILPVLGQAGSGKTHLLRTLYQNAKESRGFFIFLDLSTLTATNDFYQTLAIDAYQALAREIKGEREQVYTLLENVALHAGLSLSDFPEGNPKALEQAPLDAINQIAEKTHRGLFQKYRQKAQETRDLLRALFLLASSDHNVHHVASSVLQGTPALDGVDCGFSFNQKLNHLDIFARLTWLMSLNGSFTVLAIDQMDTIVGNYQNMRPPDGAPKSAEIIEHENIIRDLSVKMCEIVRHSVKTFTVASTISDAWETLKRFGLHSSIDRFYEPLRLSPITDEGLLAKIVAQRMADAAERAGHKLPYPTWPFPPAFMKACAGSFPREVMMECAKHISYCRKLGRAKQWGEPDEPGVNPPDGDVTRPPITLPIQARYQELLQRKINPQWKNEKEEASFWRPALNAFIEAFSASLSLSDPASSLEINPAENRKDGLVCAQLRATRESQTHELSL
ncbi:MAG: ATP-binding protein, partial [Deltaproteobacteria bacterium]|nr:ATP-binding protein [Deltaproteobacteria bacterium]